MFLADRRRPLRRGAAPRRPPRRRRPRVPGPAHRIRARQRRRDPQLPPRRHPELRGPSPASRRHPRRAVRSRSSPFPTKRAIEPARRLTSSPRTCAPSSPPPTGRATAIVPAIGLSLLVPLQHGSPASARRSPSSPARPPAPSVPGRRGCCGKGGKDRVCPLWADTASRVAGSPAGCRYRVPDLPQRARRSPDPRWRGLYHRQACRAALLTLDRRSVGVASRHMSCVTAALSPCSKPASTSP